MTDYVDNSSESELDEDSGYLVSVSDLMSGLVFIFIITLVALFPLRVGEYFNSTR